MNTHETEVRSGERFEFGRNWQRFLSKLDDTRIEAATESLKRMLGVATLEGKSFIDVGSGSGLFSLAAKRLGAAVTSFDYDPHSVACTRELKRRYFPDDVSWTITQGSVLDAGFLSAFATFDVVYSWGVLHHTGSMWNALANVAPLVRDSGLLFIAIYNDQGGASRRWLTVKKIYNRSPRLVKTALVLFIGAFFAFRAVLIRLMRFQNPIRREVARSAPPRGMSYWYDLVDWVGGYPFEVAKPEEIFRFYRDRGFDLVEMTTCAGGLGCNEYVFVRHDGHGKHAGSALQS